VLGLDQPVQHVGIEQMPFVARAARSHRRVAATATKPFGDEHARGFAQHRAADFVVGQQRGFAGQTLTGKQIAATMRMPESRTMRACMLLRSGGCR